MFDVPGTTVKVGGGPGTDPGSADTAEENGPTWVVAPEVFNAATWYVYSVPFETERS